MARVFNSVQFGNIDFFCKAAELESFTAAAEALGVTTAAISRSVARLEARLGSRLFVRTTRQIRLTEDGRAYFEQCRQAITQIAEAERAIAGKQAVPSGLLRISVPTTYGHYRMLRLLPKFALLHPNVKIDVNLSNRNIDFVEENYDLAIRLGKPEDSRLVALKLEDASLGVFASPKYLQRCGTPATLEDLRRFDCVQFVLPSTGRGMSWIFHEQGRDIEYAFDSQIRIQEDVLGCVTYAKAGGGLFQTYHFIVRDYLANGELVEVLQESSGRSRPFSILYPQNRHLSAKVRAFINFLKEEAADF